MPTLEDFMNLCKRLNGWNYETEKDCARFDFNLSKHIIATMKFENNKIKLLDDVEYTD